jgi:intracellular septation protein A
MKNLLYAIRPLALDMLATLAFAGLYAWSRSLYLAIAVGIALGAGQIAWGLARRQSVTALQWASLGLVLVMGGAAILTHDARFVMIKPTIVNLVIGASMLQPGWMARYMPPAGRPYLPRSAIVIAGYCWAGLMFLTAALNLVFAFCTDVRTWALFLAVFPTGSMILAFAVQYPVFHAIAARNARMGRIVGQAPAPN